MPYQEPVTRTLKRLKRVSNYASLLQFGGKAVIGKGVALLKVPAIGAFLFSLGFVYNAYLWRHELPSGEVIYDELDEVLAENAELVTSLDIGTLFSSVGFVGLCLLGIVLYLRGKSEYRKETRALHNGMDLLFHVKSRYIPELVRGMWACSFRLETDIFRHPGEKVPPEPERLAEFFREVTYHCEQSNTPQLVQMHRLGLSLALYEQWLKYPLFSQEDSLASIHEYRSESIAIKRRTAALENYLPLILSNINISFWHTMTMAKAQYLIWMATEDLNREFQRPNFVTPEVIVWKTPEQDAIVAAVVGDNGLARLNDKRRAIIKSLFSEDRAEARKHIFLMFQKDIVNSFKIRFRYDPNYCAGELAESPIRDAQRVAARFGMRVFKPGRLEQIEAEARVERQAVDTLIAWHDFMGLSPEQARALRIAYHIDEDRLRAGMRDRPEQTLQVIREKLSCPHYVTRKTTKLQFSRGVHLLSLLTPEIYLEVYDQLIGTV